MRLTQSMKEKFFPTVTNASLNKNIIRFLKEQGEPADVVGFMAHFDTTTLTPPEELLQVYDEFAEIAPRQRSNCCRRFAALCAFASSIRGLMPTAICCHRFAIENTRHELATGTSRKAAT